MSKKQSKKPALPPRQEKHIAKMIGKWSFTTFSSSHIAKEINKYLSR